MELGKFTTFDSQTIDTILYQVIFEEAKGKTCNFGLLLTKYAE